MCLVQVEVVMLRLAADAEMWCSLFPSSLAIWHSLIFPERSALGSLLLGLPIIMDNLRETV